jgi:prepilin-type N-terminal cleavage/methylation domain-containing protein
MKFARIHLEQRLHVRAKAFTLIELLVVLAILSILGSLSLAGLNVGRQRAKRDKTIATIRKLNDIVEGMYSDRLANGRPAASTAELLTYEMPDQWLDVQITLPATIKSSAVSRYTRIAKDPLTGSDLRPTLNAKLGPAECLWMCIARSGYEPDAIEQFRPDEITDLDGDGAKEFCDGWGQPIYFLRWAPGYTPYSAVQLATDINAATAANDLLGELNALTPLIYSAGPDGANVDPLGSGDAYGLKLPSAKRSIFSPCTEFPDVGAPVTGSTAFRDNITNHDIMAR